MTDEFEELRINNQIQSISLSRVTQTEQNNWFVLQALSNKLWRNDSGAIISFRLIISNNAGVMGKFLLNLKKVSFLSMPSIRNTCRLDKYLRVTLAMRADKHVLQNVPFIVLTFQQELQTYFSTTLSTSFNENMFSGSRVICGRTSMATLISAF